MEIDFSALAEGESSQVGAEGMTEAVQRGSGDSDTLGVCRSGIVRMFGLFGKGLYEGA